MEKNNAKPIKIVVTGPESCGKSSLCEALALHFQTSFVPEYAREYLDKTHGVYTQDDLVNIARGQVALEDTYQSDNEGLLICDTSLEVIRVWSEWKYGSCDAYILEKAHERAPHLFLLLTPDIPWQADPLRENPHNRDEIYKYYTQLLNDYSSKIVAISGDAKARLSKAIDAIRANI